MISKSYINDLSYKIVGCAIEVHNHLGPGLLESVYENCLIDELLARDFNVKSQVMLPVVYKEKDLGNILKIDILVNDLIIVELKAVDVMLPVFKAQLLSYMKLAKKPKGLLINFNSENITGKGLIPLVNEYFSALPE